MTEDAIDLNYRRTGGIEVALIWDRRTESLNVFVADAATGEEIVVPVTGEEAAEVYLHPFAYAHRAQPSHRPGVSL
jgi:hypothetical protein